MTRVVVVGAGLAGARTCAELRAAGYRGALSLIGAEADEPYDRPPLAKDPEAPVTLRDVMGLDVRVLADDVRLGTAATGLDIGNGSLHVGLADGICAPADRVPADAVVIASGAHPVLPTGWAGPRVHLLHTRAQAQRLWSAVGPGTRLLVVGGGWVGVEAAATAAGRGARVVLREAGAHLLAGRVPTGVALRVAAMLAEAGVTVRLAAPVEDLADAVDEAGGADAVLVALGVRPNVTWLPAALPRGGAGGLRTDPWGRTTTPGVLAVGDAAERWSPRYRAHLPGGHWTDALNAPGPLAGPLVAWLGSDPPGARREWLAQPTTAGYDPIPYVFSEIGGRTLQVLGRAGAGGSEGSQGGDVERPTLAWRSAGAGWTAYAVAGGRLVGVWSVGRPRDIAAARRAMLADPEGTPRVDARVLADAGAAPTAPFS